MIDRSKKLPAFFYQTANGNEPVRDWILELAPEDRKRIGRDIQKVEFGWPIGMLYCCNLGEGCGKYVATALLHGFIKKTQKTPAPDWKLAFKRRKELL